MSVSPEGYLRCFTITRRPVDYPDAEYVVRASIIMAGRIHPDPEIIGTAATLEAARALVPVEANICFDRNSGDPAHIVETWM